MFCSVSDGLVVLCRHRCRCSAVSHQLHTSLDTARLSPASSLDIANQLSPASSLDSALPPSWTQPCILPGLSPASSLDSALHTPWTQACVLPGLSPASSVDTAGLSARRALCLPGTHVRLPRMKLY